MNKLEIIDLEKVTGGTAGETTGDSENLHKLGLIDEELGFLDVTFHWESSSAKVDEAWAKVGVTCVTCFDFGNMYFYQGQRISRTKANEIASAACIKGPKIKM